MDPDLPTYLSGGFFAGDPDAIPQGIHGTPAAVLSAEPDAEHAHGLWLHADDAELFLEEERPLPPARRPPVQQWLQRATTLGELGAPAPEVLGFQLLGFDEERAWTWVDVDLVARVSAEVGASAGAFGLVAERHAAVAVAQFLNREDLGPPVIWRPWLISRHRTPVGGGV